MAGGDAKQCLVRHADVAVNAGLFLLLMPGQAVNAGLFLLLILKYPFDARLLIFLTLKQCLDARLPALFVSVEAFDARLLVFLTSGQRLDARFFMSKYFIAAGNAVSGIIRSQNLQKTCVRGIKHDKRKEKTRIN